MINKRRAIPLIVVIFLVCIVLALGLYHVFTSFDIKRSEDKSMKDKIEAGYPSG